MSEVADKAVGHTPGPWEAETVSTQVGHAHKIMPLNACLYVDHRDRRQMDQKTLRAAADARLIAAAPDLLAALQAIVASAEPDGRIRNLPADGAILTDGRAAIAKAVGG